MNESNIITDRICTDCVHAKVNSKSKYKNPDIYCIRRGNCKLTDKYEAKWCDLYKEG